MPARDTAACRDGRAWTHARSRAGLADGRSSSDQRWVIRMATAPGAGGHGMPCPYHAIMPTEQIRHVVSGDSRPCRSTRQPYRIVLCGRMTVDHAERRLVPRVGRRVCPMSFDRRDIRPAMDVFTLD